MFDGIGEALLSRSAKPTQTTNAQGKTVGFSDFSTIWRRK
uniref:Uncharacterized protein n=1 Tax=Anguilla anguilla TaxID=7936 RepID=A0A0E9VGJ8_ANGAN